MRYALLGLIPAALICAKLPDVSNNPQELAKWAVRNYQKDQLASLRYQYIENDETQAKGVETSQVTTILGTPYERLIARNGKPLSESAEKHEEEKYQKMLFSRRNELKGAHDNRVRKWKEDTRFLEEAPDAFDFKMLPETVINGRPAYVVECTPKPGFQPREERSRMFTKIKATGWVDKQDLRIVKVEADTVDAVSIGWVLARIGRGTHLELEQMRLPDGNWVLKTLSIEGRAKVLLVENKNLDEKVTYSDYKLDPNAKLVK
jgi:hypothetical protein